MSEKEDIDVFERMKKSLSNDSYFREPITMYLCCPAYEFELGEDSFGTILYPTIVDLLERHECGKDCGIIKVLVSFISKEELKDDAPS